MTSIVNFKKTERFLLLYALYKKSNANCDYGYNLMELGLQEGLGHKTFKSAFDYLVAERLVKLRAQTDNRDYFYFASLTEKGINAVEEVFNDETQSTRYFPAYREMSM